jgi:UDP-N-acetylmuramoylalanine--D-glutamate ligase
MQLQGRKLAVVGLGKSGVAAARLCLERGASVMALDEAPLSSWSDDARALADVGVAIVSGPIDSAALAGCASVVVSPGVPAKATFAELEQSGCEVISELELASRLVRGPVALIGGTNGKSTVTAWVHAMLQAAGKKVFVGGNYGTPMCEAVGQPWDALVVEISSFQAERVPTLHARVHALLNISEDHLDRYDSFQAYADAKGNPFATMGAGDVAVLPAGDDVCAAQAARGGASRIHFSAREGEGQVSPDGDVIVDRVHGGRYPIDSLRVGGTHNLANATAAIAVAGAMGANEAAIAAALASFEGLAHRHVLVAEHRGVRFYNDSKATNVGAAVAALRGLNESHAVLIAGGRDKMGAFEPLVLALRERGRALVVLGEAAARLAEAADGALPIVHATSMRDADERAAALAQTGDAVLLSPACSSFDMFASYKARGEAFTEVVREHIGTGHTGIGSTGIGGGS